MFLRIMGELKQYVSVTVVFYGHVRLSLHDILKL